MQYTCTTIATCATSRSIFVTYISKTSETIETYSCNMCFQRNISFLLGRMEARRCVVFTGGCGLTALVGGRPATVTSRRAREASAARAARRPWMRNLERAQRAALGRADNRALQLEAAMRRAWQGQWPSGGPRRRPRAAPQRATGRALGSGGMNGRPI